MHPFLTRLGVQPDVQAFFAPFYEENPSANLVFPYGDSLEYFGFAFHKVPETDGLWVAGNTNFSMTRRVFICSSAMEAIAYLSIRPALLKNRDTLLFLSTGIKPTFAHIKWIHRRLPLKEFALVYGNDLLGCICDLRIAAAIRHFPLSIRYKENELFIDFRNRNYCLKADQFSLHSFEKQCGHRFNISTPKPKKYISFLDQLKASAFNSP